MWNRLSVLFVLMQVSAMAVPVMGNLSRPMGEEGIRVSYHAWQASSFRVGDTPSSWTLRRISLALSQIIPNRHLTLRVTGETAFRPDLTDVRVAFETPMISSGETVEFEVKQIPVPRLEPNQTYWLVLSVDDLDLEASGAAGLFEWNFALDSQMDAGLAEGWSPGERTASAGSGGSSWTPETTSPFGFLIDATRNIPNMTLARWRSEHPGGAANEAVFLSADEDHDGLNGLAEFAFDSDSDNLPNALHDAANGRVGLEYVRWSQAPELKWHVEMTTDFVEWHGASVGSTEVSLVGDAQERVTVMLAEPIDRVFLRVRVTK